MTIGISIEWRETSSGAFTGGSARVTLRLKSGVKTESQKFTINDEKGWRIGW